MYAIEPNQSCRITCYSNGSQMDDNEDIIRIASMWHPFVGEIKARLAIGLETYGHGVRVEDDTTQWGTEVNSWLEMGLEEIDDLAIYVMAQLLREKKKDYDNLNEFAGILKELRDTRRRIMEVMLREDA